MVAAKRAGVLHSARRTHQPRSRMVSQSRPSWSAQASQRCLRSRGKAKKGSARFTMQLQQGGPMQAGCDVNDHDLKAEATHPRTTVSIHPRLTWHPLPTHLTPSHPHPHTHSTHALPMDQSTVPFSRAVRRSSSVLSRTTGGRGRLASSATRSRRDTSKPGCGARQQHNSSSTTAAAGQQRSSNRAVRTCHVRAGEGDAVG